MKFHRQALVAAIAAALIGAARAQTATEASAPATGMLAAEQQYLRHQGSRFTAFAGSEENLEALVVGLRRGERVVLSDGTETARFTPPTRPMGYGNITRALDLASSQLATAGITEPTPSELKAAMVGGTIVGPNGDVTLQGVLALRSEGMGWGKIAHTIGVHPGMGSAKAPVGGGAASSATLSAPGQGAGAGARGSGITTAAGAAALPSESSARAAAVRSAASHGSAFRSEDTHPGKGSGAGHAGGKR